MLFKNWIYSEPLHKLKEVANVLNLQTLSHLCAFHINRS